MKFYTIAVASFLFLSTPALAHPQPISDIQLVSPLDAHAFDAREVHFVPAVQELWKRKGGGGGNGKGGGGSGGKGGSESTGSTGGGSAPGSSGKGKGSPSSATGGATKQGSGVQPTFGGGRLYGGGSTMPYASGARSPLGITPFFLTGAALGVLPGVWLYGVYSYPYHHPYTFHNRTAIANNTNQRREFWTRQVDQGINQTKPVTCLCAAYEECGCDDSENTTFLDSLIGDGTYSALNESLVTVADVNRTSTILLNGTLPNGTTVPGSAENANHAGEGMRGLVVASGYWVTIVLVGCTVLLV